MSTTLQDFLAEISRAVARTQVEALKTYIDTLLEGNGLDIEIPIGEENDKVFIDGVSLLPEGLPQLSELTVRLKTEVSVPRQRRPYGATEEGPVPQLTVNMKRGLSGRGMPVEIEAKYRRGPKLESLEVVREKANERLQVSLQELGHKLSVQASEKVKEKAAPPPSAPSPPNPGGASAE